MGNQRWGNGPGEAVRGPGVQQNLGHSARKSSINTAQSQQSLKGRWASKGLRGACAVCSALKATELCLKLSLKE